MQRNPSRLKNTEFDLLIIGLGSHGACAARDAALRGLSVAVIDQGDICGATSHNSLKTIHGGIRYLQHLNFKRVLESIKEQKIWLRTAPHLVKPMPFLMPTYGHGARGPLAMLAGVKLFQLFGLTRNKHLRNDRRLPAGRIMSKQSCRGLAPDIEETKLTGGALWYDAQVEHADRAILQVAQHADELGAVVCNYVSATELLLENSKVIGVSAEDKITSERFTIKAKTVINAAGPWASKLLAPHDRLETNVSLIKSMNLVTNRPAPEVAIAVQSRLASDSVLGNTKRLYFIVPWLGKAVIGTTHFNFGDDADRLSVEHTEIAAFVNEINTAYPTLNLSKDDILYCYQGLSPEGEHQSTSSDNNAIQLHESKIIDHQSNHGIEGIISIFSVKWTTARLVAEQAIDLVCRKLKRSTPGRTEVEPLVDTQALPFKLEGLPEEQIHTFCETHIRNSMAMSLSDILLRRTNDLALGELSFNTTKVVAQHMSASFSWDSEKQQVQLNDLLSHWLPLELRSNLEQQPLWK
ncbi:MAG: glycerol-3-phosphate dehydrogenase/oxidase [Gammaproteobacteria bacterium]|nr:glycerol-3-phosphate dehydrogenase/oxidase [Gammaproteobacteria bacterium]